MKQQERSYTTAEVAELIGVHQRTLYRWLYAKWLPEPQRAQIGGMDVRLWSAKDIKRAEDLKLTMARGRPKKDVEAVVDKRLLDLDRQLAWYGRAMKLTRREVSALDLLQRRLSHRLIEKGLAW